MTAAEVPLSATSPRQEAAWRRRERPSWEEVRPGVWSIPVPVRGPIRFVYSYLICSGGASLLIDPGEESKAAAAALERAFAEIGFDPAGLTEILVTHFHYDHWEGADRLAERTGARVAIGSAEWRWIRSLTAEATSESRMIPWFEGLGVPTEQARELAASADYRDVLGYRPPDVLVSDGELLPIAGERLRVVETPGHSPGHLCVLDEQRGLLFAGDHLLPGITPHVALNRFGGPDPLTQYLESLERVEGLGEPEVLPAHEYRFVGVRARVRELREDIARRGEEVAAQLTADPAVSPWSAARRLSWSRPWETFSPQHRRMALDETAAHVARAHRIMGVAARESSK